MLETAVLESYKTKNVRSLKGDQFDHQVKNTGRNVCLKQPYDPLF